VSPVWIAIIRVAECVICQTQYHLPLNEWPPENCIQCGSSDWEWGAESRDSRFIRQRISRVERVLNPGVTSKKRQLWGKKQWQGFKPKPPEVKKNGDDSNAERDE
jgi:hypothetical protein